MYLIADDICKLSILNKEFNQCIDKNRLMGDAGSSQHLELCCGRQLKLQEYYINNGNVEMLVSLVNKYKKQQNFETGCLYLKDYRNFYF